jgi:hypothetical protein
MVIDSCITINFLVGSLLVKKSLSSDLQLMESMVDPETLRLDSCETKTMCHYQLNQGSKIQRIFCEIR